jgi:hypothetical protein
VTAGAFCFLTSYITTLSTVGILGVMALGALHSALVGVMHEGDAGAALLGSVESNGLGTGSGYREAGDTANQGQGSKAKHDFLNHFFSP